jgi:hypothetical protein
MMLWENRRYLFFICIKFTKRTHIREIVSVCLSVCLSHLQTTDMIFMKLYIVYLH